MAVKLKFGDTAPTSTVHSIPCKIHADSHALVSNYFKPVKVEGEDDLAASFRGYPLDGVTVKLPSGVRGVVVNVDDPTEYRAEATFKEMTYWNWNKKPSKNDPFLSALDWISMSKAIHDPIGAVSNGKVKEKE